MFLLSYFDEALKLGDKIVILKDGKIIPAEIILRPKTEYVRKFVEDVKEQEFQKLNTSWKNKKLLNTNGAMLVNQEDFLENQV